MNVPKLRFKEFTDEWQKVKISSFVNESKRKTGDIKKYPLWSLTIENGVTPKTDRYERSFLVKKEDNYKIVYPNYYVYNPMNAHLGAIARNKSDKSISVSGYYDIFSINNDYYGFYDNYFISPVMFKKYKLISSGSLLEKQRVHYSQFKELKIYLPSDKEQEKIAKLLSLLDKKIALQTKKIETLKLFKLSITQNIFNEKKLNDFQSVTLEKILKPGSKIPVKNTSEYEKMTVKLNFKGLAKLEIKKEMADTRPFYVRNENEIIIGKQNYFNGSIAKVTKDFKGCICSNAIMSFTTINGVNVDYVLYYLSQKNYINRRKFLANGTGQKELSEKEFLKFVIKLPSTQIQNDISKKISCVSNLLLLENKKLTTLNNLKKGLLQNLFI